MNGQGIRSRAVNSRVIIPSCAVDSINQLECFVNTSAINLLINA